MKLKLTYENIFYMIWIFFMSTNSLFWASNLKQDYNVSKILLICDLLTIILLIIYFFSNTKYEFKKQGRLFLYDLLKENSNTKYEFKKLIIIFFVFMITFIVELNTQYRDLLLIFLFIINSSKIKFDKFIKVDIKLRIFWVLFIFMMYRIGITDNWTAIINGSYKQSLGFQHANTFAMYAFLILLEWLFLRNSKMSIKERIYILLAFFLIMQISKSRTTGYAFAIIYILYFINRYFPSLYKNKIVSTLFIIMSPIATLFSVYATKLYISGNKIAVLLNQILTTRLALQAYYWEKYPLVLFGQKIDTSVIMLDNAYIRCIISYGIIFTIVLNLLYMLVIKKSIEHNNIRMAIFVLFFVWMGIGETSMLRMVINVSFIGLLNAIAQKRNFRIKVQQ